MSSPGKPDMLAQIGKYLNDLNGRDKISKFIQYGSRYLMYHYLSQDPKSATGQKFKGLFAMTRDARKLVRLFKSINEFVTIQDLLNKKGDPVTQGIQIVGRVGWGQYWFFDNLVYLQKAKFYEPATDAAYWGALGWFYALVCGIVVNVRELGNIAEQERALKSKERTDETKKQWAALQDKKQKLSLQTVANLADLTCAANGIKIPEKLLGYGLNDGILGICGVISATIAGYYRWREVNP